MISVNLLVKKKQKFRQLKKRNTRFCFLQKSPQKRGTCKKIIIVSPKKPNSAKRKIAKVEISTKKTLFVYIPGQGPHYLSQFSVVLIRGGRVRDLPGIRYKMIRGVKDYIFDRHRITSRSKYGRKKGV